jgi:tetratricopeptide (TPR) repeat protein
MQTLALILMLVSAQSLASDADRRDALTHYRAGQEFLSAEQWDKAVTAFQSAVKFDPLFTDAHYGLGQAFMGLKQYASAAQAFERCLNAARTMHGLRDKDRVNVDRQINDELRELKEQESRLARMKGGTMARRTALEQRIRELERSRSSVGNAFEPPASVLLSLGSAHFRNDNQEKAEEYWTEAVKQNPKLGEAWNNLAVIYLRTSRKADAENAVKSAERAGYRVNPRLKDDIRALR